MNTVALTIDYCTRCAYLEPALNLAEGLLSHFKTEITIRFSQMRKDYMPYELTIIFFFQMKTKKAFLK
jgi:predicted Rdx family selenoprotein